MRRERKERRLKPLSSPPMPVHEAHSPPPCKKPLQDLKAPLQAPAHHLQGSRLQSQHEREEGGRSLKVQGRSGVPPAGFSKNACKGEGRGEGKGWLSRSALVSSPHWRSWLQRAWRQLLGCRCRRICRPPPLLPRGLLAESPSLPHLLHAQLFPLAKFQPGDHSCRRRCRRGSPAPAQPAGIVYSFWRSARTDRSQPASLRRRRWPTRNKTRNGKGEWGNGLARTQGVEPLI